MLSVRYESKKRLPLRLILLRTPGSVPLGLAYVLLVETNPFPNLSSFYRTMLFEYPSVLSRFCHCYTILKSDLIDNINHTHISGNKPSSVHQSQSKYGKILKCDVLYFKTRQSQKGRCKHPPPPQYNFERISTRNNFTLQNCYESIDVEH